MLPCLRGAAGLGRIGLEMAGWPSCEIVTRSTEADSCGSEPTDGVTALDGHCHTASTLR